MDIPAEFIPPFVSPLSHDQHARLGRIAILWGQIDMILDQLLQAALNITGEQRVALIGERPIGGKLDLLKNNLHGIKDKKAREGARDFWELANDTKSVRNRCFHGIWGFGLGRKETLFAGASHFREIENPFRATQLPSLEKKLCKTARLGWNALAIVMSYTHATKGCSRLFHGKGDIPAWLVEWRAQHPLDDRALDRRHKRNQLPYLAKPL